MSVYSIARATPLLVSRSLPLVTVMLSDISGPRTRQRLVVQDASLPSWLPSVVSGAGASHETVAVAMGRAPTGSRTRIRSIVIYPAQNGEADIAFVYVEEHSGPVRMRREAFPLHVVRCPPLPKGVRFVELKAMPQSHEAPLRSVENSRRR